MFFILIACSIFTVDSKYPADPATLAFSAPTRTDNSNAGDLQSEHYHQATCRTIPRPHLVVLTLHGAGNLLNTAVTWHFSSADKQSGWVGWGWGYLPDCTVGAVIVPYFEPPESVYLTDGIAMTNNIESNKKKLSERRMTACVLKQQWCVLS